MNALAVEPEQYSLKDYSTADGWRFTLEMLWGLVMMFPWFWKRLRPFRGTVVTIEKYPAEGIGTWGCSRVLVRNRRGRLKWQNCHFYPFYKVEPGETVTRWPFIGLYVIREGVRIRVKRS